MKQTKTQALKSRIALLQSQIKSAQQELTSAAKVDTGEVPAPYIAKLIASQKTSFAVVFVRKCELNKPKNKKKGLSFTSDRRFATLKEANQHGKRFSKKHSHKGFHAITVKKKANSWINWATGKTNPVA